MARDPAQPAGKAGKLLLLGASLIVCFALGEGVMRAVHRAWPFTPAAATPDGLGPEEASLRWRFSAEEGRNRLGLRDGEIGPPRPGTPRILFLGDSLFWSSETSSGALYTETLEAPLGADIVNAGVPGYTLYQQLEFLRIHGLAMQPDLVLLGFVVNDVYDPYLHRPSSRGLLDLDPDYRLHWFDGGRWPARLLARSHLAHAVARTVRLAAGKLTGEPLYPFQRRGDFYLAWEEHAWPPVRRRLTAMRELLAERGVPLAVAAFPIAHQLDPALRARDEAFVLRPQRRLAAICADLGLPLLDREPALAAAGGPDQFTDGLHLTPAGNDRVAAALEEFLRPLLPAPAAKSMNEEEPSPP